MFGKILFITCCPLLTHYSCKMIIGLDNSKDILKNGCWMSVMGLIKHTLLLTRIFILAAIALILLNVIVTKVVKHVMDRVRQIVWAVHLDIIYLINQLVIFFVIMVIIEINQIFVYLVVIIA